MNPTPTLTNIRREKKTESNPQKIRQLDSSFSSGLTSFRFCTCLLLLIFPSSILRFSLFFLRNPSFLYLFRGNFFSSNFPHSTHTLLFFCWLFFYYSYFLVSHNYTLNRIALSLSISLFLSFTRSIAFDFDGFVLPDCSSVLSAKFCRRRYYNLVDFPTLENRPPPPIRRRPTAGADRDVVVVAVAVVAGSSIIRVTCSGRSGSFESLDLRTTFLA